MELYPLFLDCGYSPLLFAQLSPNEIADLLESHRRRQEERDREHDNYLRLAVSLIDASLTVLVHNLGVLFPDSKVEPLQLKDFFPQLFEDMDADEKNGAENEPNKLPPNMQLYKAQRIDHAYRVNAQRAERSGEDGRGNAGKTESSI